MIKALIQAWRDLSLDEIRLSLLICIGGTLGGFFLMLAAIWVGLSHLNIFDLGLLNHLVAFAGGIGSIFLAWMLYPAIVIGISFLLIDQIADAIEKKHYPHLGPPKERSLIEEAKYGGMGFGRAMGFNLIMFPIYLIPGINLIAFYLVNGWLLGRELYETVARRHMDAVKTHRIEQQNKANLFKFGIIVAFLSIIPLINLIVAILATATMVHLVQKMTLPPPTEADAAR